ncbi:MAG: methyltransferase domain-containing protein [Vicinamibacterales bacterium]
MLGSRRHLSTVSAAEHFTVLTCHQGLQFMPDKPAAIREMRRVLAPGGRVAVATWRSLENHAGVCALNAVAERHVGQIADSRHSCGDPSARKSLLAESGFGHVEVQTVAHDVQFADGALFARLNAMAVIGMSEQGKTMSEAERGELAGRIAAESQDVIVKATKNGACVLSLTTNIATADV